MTEHEAWAIRVAETRLAALPMSGRARLAAILEQRIAECHRALPYMVARLTLLVTADRWAEAVKCSAAANFALRGLTTWPQWVATLREPRPETDTLQGQDATLLERAET